MIDVITIIFVGNHVNNYEELLFICCLSCGCTYGTLLYPFTVYNSVVLNEVSFRFRYSSCTGRRIKCPPGGGERAAIGPKQSPIKYAPTSVSGKANSSSTFKKCNTTLKYFEMCIFKAHISDNT